MCVCVCVCVSGFVMLGLSSCPTVHRAWGVSFRPVQLGAAGGPGCEGRNAVQRWDVVNKADLCRRIASEAAEKLARLLHDFVRVTTVLAAAVNKGTG